MTISGLPAEVEPWFAQTERWISMEIARPCGTFEEHQVQSLVLAFARNFRNLRALWVDFNMKVLGAP